MAIALTFPDGNVKNFDDGTTVLAVAQSISVSLGKKAVAGLLDDTLIDIEAPITHDAKSPSSPKTTTRRSPFCAKPGPSCWQRRFTPCIPTCNSAAARQPTTASTMTPTAKAANSPSTNCRR